MTLEELIALPIEKIERMADKQLEEFLAPYFNVTRPTKELRDHNATRKTESSERKFIPGGRNLSDEKFQKLRKIAAATGVDIKTLMGKG